MIVGISLYHLRFSDNLQVIKVLLMTITSLHCEVHEASLLLAVRACFHIHLISKNLINKTTAKAALTQIISVTNQRMESNDALRQAAEAAANLVVVNSAGNAVVSDNGLDSSDKSSGGGADSAPTSVSPTPAAATTGASLVFSSVYHKDAYLLFRALCKLSMKGLSEETQYAHTDAIPLQNK